MCKAISLFHIVLFCVVNNEAAKILAVFPMPSISHQVVFRPITQELVNRGHEVTVITTDPVYSKENAPKNLREIDVHDLSYKEFIEVKNLFVAGQQQNHKQLVTEMVKFLRKVNELQMKHKDIAELIKAGPANKFDLIIVEAVFRPMYMLAHVFDAPLILISSLGGLKDHFYRIGAPTHPFLYPTSLQQKTLNLTIIDKLKTISFLFIYNILRDYNINQEYEMLKGVLGEDIPHPNDIGNRIKMLLLNVHPIWDGNRPVPPGIVYMGGIHQNAKKDLPKDLQDYMDKSKNGIIYLSFGTNMLSSNIQPDRVKIITNVLSKLPYDVLWKWDADELPGQSANIKISKWFPQSDLLRHPKIKLFITQCGLQSTDEAIAAGVPLLGFPMFADQWFNAEKYEEFKIGERHYFDTFTEVELKDAIERMIDDESYRRNIIRLRDIMNDQPTKPVDRAVFWIEHLLKHGGEHLRSPAANMSIFEYIDVPLLSILVLIALALFSVIGYLLLLMFRLVRKIVSGTKKLKAN